MAKLNVGVIGLGRLGRVYVRDLSTRIPCTRVVAIADVDKAAVDEVSKQFEVAKGYTDPQALIDDPSVDAVVIVSPTKLHASHTEAAAAKGKEINRQVRIARRIAGPPRNAGAQRRGQIIRTRISSLFLKWCRSAASTCTATRKIAA